MIATPIRTRKLLPPQDDLLAVLSESLTELSEGSIVAISSKVVAIWQGRCVPIDASRKQVQKEELIKAEAEHYLERNHESRYPRMFTIYEGLFTSSAGIDESNSDGYFTLLPQNADQVATKIRAFLAERFGVEDLGVVIVDSKSAPLRNGVVGVALGHAGFCALYDYRGTADLFGRPLQFERLNVADCVATTATLVMGEGNECMPVAVCTEVPHVEFGTDKSSDPLLRPKVPLEEDVFAQFLKPQPWQKGGGSGSGEKDV